jgi:hypothetical protein
LNLHITYSKLEVGFAFTEIADHIKVLPDQLTLGGFPPSLMLKKTAVLDAVAPRPINCDPDAEVVVAR